MGSSLFLRSVYGNGYYLTLVKDDWSGDSSDGEKQKKEVNQAILEEGELKADVVWDRLRRWIVTHKLGRGAYQVGTKTITAFILIIL